jgi:hypothetical protein
MKKIIFSLLVAAGFSYAAHAQQDATYECICLTASTSTPPMQAARMY